ncbi:hypothetical protein [Kitasatospora herbaricolor]|uniref:Uncharacterized protein n=1 Tax=Kitasatospora herbaricolor TaxID=68217 RepID=A0ABZ1W3V3_9ACTN|nr:hypothetical protein [Kitasatospora herbaricolor]
MCWTSGRRRKAGSREGVQALARQAKDWSRPAPEDLRECRLLRRLQWARSLLSWPGRAPAGGGAPPPGRILLPVRAPAPPGGRGRALLLQVVTAAIGLVLVGVARGLLLLVALGTVLLVAAMAFLAACAFGGRRPRR